MLVEHILQYFFLSNVCMMLCYMQEFQTMVVFKEKAKSWNLLMDPSQKILYSIFGNYTKARCGSNVWEKIFMWIHCMSKDWS